MDYTSLTGAKTVEGSIRNWVNSDKVPAGEVLADAENWLEQMLRTKSMQKRYDFSLSIGQTGLDLSTFTPDFLDPVLLWNKTDACEVDLIPEFEIDNQRDYDADGLLPLMAPTYYASIGRSTLLFDSRADRAYPMVLTYYARPTALAAGNQQNLYTQNYRLLLRQVCMSLAYLFLKDEGRADGLLSLAATMVKQVSEIDDLGRRGERYDTRTR